MTDRGLYIKMEWDRAEYPAKLCRAARDRVRGIIQGLGLNPQMTLEDFAASCYLQGATDTANVTAEIALRDEEKVKPSSSLKDGLEALRLPPSAHGLHDALLLLEEAAELLQKWCHVDPALPLDERYKNTQVEHTVVWLKKVRGGG